MNRKSSEFRDILATPYVFEEATVREYAETHSAEAVLAYLDGVKAISQMLQDIVSPPFKDGTVDSASPVQVKKNVQDFVRHKRQLLERLTIEFSSIESGNQSRPVSDTRVQP